MEKDTTKVSVGNAPFSLVQNLRGALIDKHLFDVTLVTQDHVLHKSHKLILSAFSPVFKTIFMNSPSFEQIIYLRGIKSTVMEFILKFIYCGEVILPNHILNEFKNVSKDLEIKNLQFENVEVNPPNDFDHENIFSTEYEFKVDTDTDIQVVDMINKQVNTVNSQFSQVNQINPFVNHLNPFNHQVNKNVNQVNSVRRNLVIPVNNHVYPFKNHANPINNLVNVVNNRNIPVYIPVNHVRNPVNNQINHVNNQVNPVNTLVHPVNNQVNLTNHQVSPVNNQVNQINNQINPVNNQVDQINNRVNQANNQVNPVNHQVNPVNNQVNSVNNQVNPVNNQVNQINNQVNSDNNHINPVNNQVNPVNNQVNKDNSQINYYECHFQNCSYKNQSHDILQIHIGAAHEQRKFECSKCEYKGSDRVYFRMHMEEVHKERVEVATNNLLIHPFSYEKDINVEEDLKSKGYHCKFCGTDLETEQLHRTHMIDVHLYYGCDFCNFTARIRAKITMHTQAVHEGRKLSCDQCDHESTDPSNLRRHIRMSHKMIRYNCDYCNYSGTTSSALKGHNLKHHQEKCEMKEYKCKICSTRLDTKELYKTHMIDVHLYYSCDICNSRMQVTTLEILSFS